MVRYADDFVVLAASHDEALDAWQAAGTRLGHIQLAYSPHKTRITHFDEGFTFLGVTFYEDRYSYDYMDKHIQINGRKLRWLYRCPPEFY